MIFTIGNRCRQCSTMKNIVYFTSKINHEPRRSNTTSVDRYPDYQMIYKFPLIRAASIVNKLKLYQTVITGVGIPATAILAAFDILTTETAMTYAVAGISWSLAFAAVGFLGHNRIGFIYMKNDETSLKISYTDFWGRRVDTDIEVNDIWPLNDLPNNVINPFYYSLRRYSNNDTYKFNLKQGIIVDPIKFRQVFGNPDLTAKR